MPRCHLWRTSIDAVFLFTLADARPQQIRQALAGRKHVLAEKSIGPDDARNGS
jgi:predicted dehydrogenase